MLLSLFTYWVLFSTKIATVIASYIVVIAYTPQLWKSYKTKDVSGISLPFWILMNIFLFCMFNNATALWVTTHSAGSFGYFITEGLNWGFAIAQLYFVVKYGKEDRKAKRIAKKKAKAEKKNK